MTRGMLIASLLLAAACANEKTEQRADTLSTQPAAGALATRPAPGDAPAAPRGPTLHLSIPGGPPGSKVTLSMGGLVLHAKVDVGFGGFVEHVILEHDTASVDGDFASTVTVPASTTPGTWYFFLADTDSGQPFGLPVAFLVTAKDGTVTLSGKLTDEGVECRAFRSDSEELYSLTGGTNLPPSGTEVMLQGTIVQQSTCQQGVTIAVKSIRAK